MRRLHPGWLVALCAATLSVSVWLPWLTTTADGGGHASAVGGTAGSLTLPPRFGVGQVIALLASVLLVAGAMAGRGLSARLASVAALVVSSGVVALVVCYYRLNVVGSITVGYGLYVGAGSAAAAVLCALWALVAVSRGR